MSLLEDLEARCLQSQFGVRRTTAFGVKVPDGFDGAHLWTSLAERPELLGLVRILCLVDADDAIHGVPCRSQTHATCNGTPHIFRRTGAAPCACLCSADDSRIPLPSLELPCEGPSPPWTPLPSTLCGIRPEQSPPQHARRGKPIQRLVRSGRRRTLCDGVV